jgi:SAM-dependent methyltransferase
MKKEHSLFKFDEDANSLLDIVYSFQKSRILITAFELDLFNIINENSKTAREITFELNTEEFATRKFLDALVTLNILVKSGDRYSIEKKYLNLITKGSSHYIGNLRYFNFVWDCWTKLTDSLKRGSSALLKEGRNHNEYLEDILFTLQWRATQQANTIIKNINLHLVNKALDLGCGTGGYAMELLKAKPNIEMFAFDLPEVIEITKKYVEIKGFSDRITTLSGDFFLDNIGSEYDLVMVSNVMSRFSFYQNITLLRKIYDSLNNGGMLVIQDYLINDNRISPEFQALHNLNLLVTTESGNVYTETDMWMMLKESWFSNFRRIDTEFGTSIIFGYK